MTKTDEFADKVSSEWLLYSADKEIDTLSQDVTSDMQVLAMCITDC